MRYYTAMFIPHQVEGQTVYDVMFPDVPGCYSQGSTLEQAVENAAEALHCHLGTDPVSDWPTVGSLEEAKAKAYAEAEQEGEPLPEGTQFMLVKVPEPAYTVRQEPVRLSISLKPAIVEKVDAAAQELGITRSGLIALATREYIMSKNL